MGGDVGSVWLTEWNRAQDAYFGQRHKVAHFEAVTDTLRPFIPAGGTVLDFGPGDALHIPAVAGACSLVLLCEESDVIRDALIERFGADPAVRVLGPEGLRSVPDGSVDLLVAHSVFQYLAPTEVDAFLEAAGRILSVHGVLLVGDLVGPDHSAARDVWQLVRFAARHRFLTAAVAHLVRLPFTPYTRARRRAGLANYAPADLLVTVARHGLAGQVWPTNLGNNTSRWTLHARRSQAST